MGKPHNVKVDGKTEQSQDQKRVPIAYLRATVEFPLYKGDSINRTNGADSWNDFIYEEAGITPRGELGVCRRECKTLGASVVWADEHAAEEQS